VLIIILNNLGRVANNINHLYMNVLQSKI